MLIEQVQAQVDVADGLRMPVITQGGENVNMGGTGIQNKGELTAILRR